MYARIYTKHVPKSLEIILFSVWLCNQFDKALSLSVSFYFQFGGHLYFPCWFYFSQSVKHLHNSKVKSKYTREVSLPTLSFDS